jgi:hypothetical protein
MKDLFNGTFLKFTMGFVGILLASFLLAAVVAHLDAEKTMPAAASTGPR